MQQNQSLYFYLMRCTMSEISIWPNPWEISILIIWEKIIWSFETFLIITNKFGAKFRRYFTSLVNTDFLTMLEYFIWSYADLYILRVWECVDHSVILISFFFNDCYVPLAQLVGSVSCKMTQVMMCIQFILEQQVLWKNVSCLRSEEFCGRRFPGVASKTTNFPAPPFQNQKTLRIRPWLPYNRGCL